MVEEKKSLLFGIISITYIYIIISIPVYHPIVVSCSPFVIPTPNDTAPNSYRAWVSHVVLSLPSAIRDIPAACCLSNNSAT